METKVMGPRSVAFIMSEAAGALSRENIVVAAEQEFPAGAPLSRVLEAASAAKAGGNTGDGTFVLDAEAPLRADAKPGVYKLRCIAAATNSGTFRLYHPDGSVLVDVTITGGAGGTAAVDNQIKGVITDGGTDFAAGDGFDITVADAGEYVAYAPGGILPDAIAMYPATTAEDETTRIAAFARNGEVNGNFLVYPADSNVALINAALARSGIIVR